MKVRKVTPDATIHIFIIITRCIRAFHFHHFHFQVDTTISFDQWLAWKFKMFSFRAWLKQFLAKEINFKKYLIISIVVFVSGAFMPFISVPMIEKTIVKFLGVLKPGHLVRSKHEQKLPFTYKLYLWNVTNPNEVSAGTEKPKMQEVGPYVFK